MKRKFLLLAAFFLNSCVQTDFHDYTGCPIRHQKQRLTLLFEYGSAELNEPAVRRLKRIASDVRKNDDFICLSGRLSYHGAAADQALGALDRARNAAAVFLQEGVDLKKIYIGMAPQQKQIGLSQPLSAVEEKHTLEILIGSN